MSGGERFAYEEGMRYPCGPPALAILLGVSASGLVAVSPPAAAVVAGAAWVLAAAGARWWTERASVALTLAAFAACGFALGSDASWRVTHTQARAALAAAAGVADLTDEPEGSVILTGRLDDDAAPSSSGGARLTIQALTFESNGMVRPAIGGLAVGVVGAVSPSMLDQWRRGRVVKAPAQLKRPARYENPGVPDFELALGRRGITLVGSIKSGWLVEVVEQGSAIDETCAAIRAKVRGILDRVVGRHSTRSAAIVRAVILGDRTGLDEETEERLQRAGTYHVIAISGGNIAILATVLFVVTRQIVRVRAVPEILVAVGLAAYAVLVGGGASVNRATLMAIILLTSRCIDGRGDAINAMACAAGIMLTAEPLVIFDTGAWLTFGATLGIILAAPTVASVAARLPAWLTPGLALFAASLAAELALFPISALVFSRVTAAGLVLNFAAIPLMTVVQLGGMVVVALADYAAWLAGPVGYVTHLAAWGLVESARFVDLVPWVTTRLPPPGTAVIAVYYVAWLVGLGAGSWPRPWPRRLRACATFAIVAAGGWIIAAPTVHRDAADKLRLTFIDVGQGDATLVEFPTGQAWMIDAGGATGSRFDVARRVIEPVIWEMGVRRLTQLVFTHGDTDHIGGAPSLVADLGPDDVWEGIPVPRHEPLNHLRELVARRGARWRSVQRGDGMQVGAVTITVRHPPPPDWERQRVRNDDSVVIELRYRDVRFLLPGDVESVGEQSLATLLRRDGLTVMQAPHHGSSSSSSGPLIAAARPAVVVMSVGRKNRFGHPSPAVVERYLASGAAVYRTDLDGAVTIQTDGQSVDVQTFHGRRQHLEARQPQDARRP